jgi:hypothetical protein
MSPLSDRIRFWSRGWGRIAATVATSALMAVVWLSLAPAAGAAELFGSPVQIPTGLPFNSPVALTLGDFQGTGGEDIAAISPTAVSWIRSEGGGAFAPPVVTNLGTAASDIATLPNPGGLDYAAIAEPENDSIDIGSFVGPRQGFTSVQQLSLASVGCTPAEIAVGDFTGEAGGSDDFAVRCQNLTSFGTQNEIAVVLAAPPTRPGGNPNWVVSQSLSVSGNLMSITTAGDAAGGVDIVATSQIPELNKGLLDTFRPSGVPGVFEPGSQGSEVGQDFLQVGGLGVPESIVSAAIGGSAAVIAGSFALDGLSPLVAYLGLSNGSFPAFTNLPSSGLETPLALATGLFNGNSVADVAVAERLSNNNCLITIDTGEGTGAFTAGASLASCAQLSDMKVGDLNGEGLDDIVYTSEDNGLSVLYQDPPEFVGPIEIGHGPVDRLDETQPVASDVGLLIQRHGKPRRIEVPVKTPTGTKQVTRELPTFITVGKIPLGHHHKGHNTIHYKLLVNGHPLTPGSYIVTLRSLNAKGQVLDLSQPVALTVDRHRHAHFGKHVLV